MFWTPALLLRRAHRRQEAGVRVSFARSSEDWTVWTSSVSATWAGRDCATWYVLTCKYLAGADIVEVAPPYDTQASLTQMAAADLVWEILGLMVKRGPLVEGTQSMK